MTKKEIKNVKATIEYDGINFNGFQKQELQKNTRTVQEKIEEIGKKIFKKEIQISGSGRTDAMVHAMGQVISFKVETNMDEKDITNAFNSMLPDDIVFTKVEFVDIDFDARKSSKMKTYRYVIRNSKTSSAINRNRELVYRHKLDYSLMELAIKDLIGEHDFAGFMSKGSSAKSTIRTIYEANIQKQEDTIIIEITANGFLYNMVRIIVGTLLEIGNKTKDVDNIKKILETKDRSLAGKRVEPQGLYLMKVEY